jgi:hypothetical protein
LHPAPTPSTPIEPVKLALQSTLQQIVDTTRSSRPEPLPVLIFLYGDYSSMNRSEADHFIGDLLETSAISFGVRDRRSPHIWFAPGEQKEIAHYVATQDQRPIPRRNARNVRRRFRRNPAPAPFSL